MPQYNTNLIPASPGLNLGSSVQPWNLWAGLINGQTPVTQQIIVNAFNSTMAFVSTGPLSVQKVTLIGNVTSGTFAGVPGIVIFQITQDATGSRTFAWPTSFKQPQPVSSAASSVFTQMFYYDGTNGWPVAPGVIYP